MVSPYLERIAKSDVVQAFRCSAGLPPSLKLRRTAVALAEAVRPAVSGTLKVCTGADLKVCTTSVSPREVFQMRATVILFVVFSLLSPPAVLAGAGDSPFQQSVARAAKAASALAQGANDDGNPYVTPALVMIAAGAGVIIMGSTMPQLRTQTDDYDLCAAAHGGPTGPSTRNSACDDFRTANKGMVWTGAAVAVAGVSLLTVGAVRNVTVRVLPGGAFVGKTKRF